MLLTKAKKMVGAMKIVRMCADLKPHERVLVLTDFETLEVGELVAMAAIQIAPETALMVIAPTSGHGAEPPAQAAQAMIASDLIMMPLKFSMTHAAAVKAARKQGARVLSMGDFNAGMLAEGGIEADFDRLADVVRQTAECLGKGNRAEIRTPAGTHLTMDIAGRQGFAEDGTAHEPGSIAGPPNVEANVGPLEGTASGELVVDGSIPHPLLGIITEPIRLTVNEGRITRIHGGEQAQILSDLLEDFDDPNVYNIAELGIGLNPCSSITGSMMEDEGAYGTCHIGIGDNTSFGGKVKARTHLDLVMRRAEVIIDGEYLEKNGKLQNIKMIDE